MGFKKIGDAINDFENGKEKKFKVFRNKYTFSIGENIKCDYLNCSCKNIFVSAKRTPQGSIALICQKNYAATYVFKNYLYKEV